MRRLSTVVLMGALLCGAQPISQAGDYEANDSARPEMNLLEEQYKITLSVKSKSFPLPMSLKGTMGAGEVDIYWNFFVGKKKILSGELAPGYKEFYINAPFVEDSYVKAQIESDGTLSSFAICEVENDDSGQHPGFCYITGKGRLHPDVQIDFSYVDDADAWDLYRIHLAPEQTPEHARLTGGVERFNAMGTPDQQADTTVVFKGKYKQKHK